MHEYIIEGGHPIQGTVTASGNKNAALPCLTATLLTAEPVILHNIPEIQDTNVMIEILKSLGAKVEKLSKNAQKMRDLESRMDEIESRIENIKVINQKNRVDDKVSQKDIDDLYQQIVKLTMEYEKALKERVNDRFIVTFDEMGQRVYESDKKLQELKDMCRIGN